MIFCIIFKLIVFFFYNRTLENTEKNKTKGTGKDREIYQSEKVGIMIVFLHGVSTTSKRIIAQFL